MIVASYPQNGASKRPLSGFRRRSDAELIERWITEERELHAPALARYEIANVLTRQLAAGQLSKEDIKNGWQAFEELPITYHALLDGPAAGMRKVGAMLSRASTRMSSTIVCRTVSARVEVVSLSAAHAT